MKQKIVVLVMFLSAAVSDVSGQQASAPLTLQSVVDSFVEKNLEIEAARHQLERVKADRIAARLRPNPGLSVAAENIAFSGPTPFRRLYEIAASYSETIELGGKRELRERVANLVVTAEEARFEDTMRRGLAAVKRLYYGAVLARHNVEVANENRQTFDQVVQFNLIRFREGAIAEGDLIKVRLERMKFESAVKQAELSLRQATIRLQEKLGESSFAVREVAGDLNFRLTPLDRDTLRQFALNERADVRAVLREVETANERLALEQARAKPDISPFAGYKRVGSDNTVIFGVNVPLKVRDRNEAEIARAATDIKAAETRLQLVRNRALAEVESAYQALLTARQQVEMFQNELLRQADESRAITLAAYEEGGTELLPVLEAQRTRAEVRQQYFKALFDYQAGMVDIELAVGREIQQ